MQTIFASDMPIIRFHTAKANDKFRYHSLSLYTHNYKTKVDDNFRTSFIWSMVVFLRVSVPVPVCMRATKIQLGLVCVCVCCVGCWKKALDSIHNEIML